MQCLYPISIKVDPGIYRFRERELVPCGRCEACLKQKAQEWFIRLKFEQLASKHCYFVTLTYDDDHLPQDLNVSRRDVKLFHYKLRQAVEGKFKYFLTSEYGSKGYRPHYHGIYFDLFPEDLPKIEACWKNGFVKILPVFDGGIKYVCGYVVSKLFVPEGREPVFNMVSKNLGYNYLETKAEFNLHDIDRAYVPFHGQKFPLPRYYRDKIYSDRERLLLRQKREAEAWDRVDQFLKSHSFHQYAVADEESKLHYARLVRYQHQKQKSKL